MPGLERILRGVLRYEKTEKSALVTRLNALKANPQEKPNCLMMSCMDSRVYPREMTGSKIGHMFILRNAGNMMPRAAQFESCAGHNAAFPSDTGVCPETAALEFVCIRAGIKEVLICGHSDCRAISALHQLYLDSSAFQPHSSLDLYLRKYGWPSIDKFRQRKLRKQPITFVNSIPAQTFQADIDPEDDMRDVDVLSQLNVLQQLENVCTHHILRDELLANRIRLHAMFFDVRTGDAMYFSKKQKQFINITDKTVEPLIAEMNDSYKK